MTTQAHSLFAAVRHAYNWFQDSYWRGSRPTPETVFTVTVTSKGVFRVLAARALAAEQATLFPKPGAELNGPEAFDPR